MTNAHNPASVTVGHMADIIVITVTGEVDMTTAPAFEKAVRASLDERPATLVIDLNQAQFFSSAGIAVLVLAHRGSPAIGLRVVVTEPAVLRLLELTGLVNDLAIHSSLESAIDDVSEQGRSGESQRDNLAI